MSVDPLYEGNGKVITWGELKKALENQGVQDDTPVTEIDLDGATARFGVIVSFDAEDGGVEVQ